MRTFKQGHEAREIWRWLVERERQDRLPRALTEIGREDLAALMAAGPVRKIAADVTDFTALPPLYGHTGYVERLTFTPDGRTLLSGSWDHSLRVWDLATGEQQACFEHPKWVSDLVLTSDGRLVMTASGGINVFDLAALEPREPFAGHDNAGHEKVWNLALAPDDRTLFSIGDQTVRAWDVATRTQLAVFPSETSLNRIAIAGPDLIVVGTSNGAIVPFRLERATRSAARRRAGGGRRA